LKQIQKNIILYEQIIVDKKMKNENTIFLEDMLNKLIEKETLVQQKINERKQYTVNTNTNEKYINSNDKVKNYNYFNTLDFSPIKSSIFNNNNFKLKNNINMNKLSIRSPKLISDNIKILNNSRSNSSSILITNQSNNYKLNNKNIFLTNTSKKIMLKTELTEEKIQEGLSNIFLFYSSLNIENVDNNGIDNNNINNKFINLNNYFKFCYDFKIPITKPKINDIFKQACNNGIDNNNLIEMNFEQFKSSLKTLSLEINSIKKQKLLKYISEKKKYN
jgi:hypothetical protein